MLGFALLFFFLNHMVESTILDLELVFEHRNYIPSMFFFLPLSFFCVSYFKDLKIQKNNRFMLVLSSILLTCFIFILGMGTYLRNIEWKTEKSLWLSALEKAPGRSRPYQNYSAFHVQFQKDWDFVIELNKESLEKNNSKPAYSKMVAYVNLGLGYEKKGEIEKAIKYRQKAIEVFPLKENIAGYLQLLVKADKIETAAKAILQNIKHKNLNQMGLNLRTLIYLKDHQLKPALKSGLEAILKDPFDLDAITYFGYANMVNNEYARAEHYLNKAISLNSPNQLYIGIALIQNYFGQKDMAKAEEQTLKVLEHFSLEDIFSMLDSIQKDAYPILPLSEEEIRAAFAREIKVQTKELENGRAWKTQEPNI
ncbi:MAG: hypothetical protein HUN05_16935 [Desulfobacter sp.]|nr:MAG: hypothetical protein HUN05_16935 [Desulfobacter sp.]